TTLIALLRTVAYSWRQEALARNAAAVHQLGRGLHGRLATMGTHVAKLGRSLDSAVDSYNRTVSSLEARVLVTARKLTELQVAHGELPEPGQVERSPRTVSAPELVASADEYLIALDERGRGDDGEHESRATVTRGTSTSRVRRTAPNRFRHAGRLVTGQRLARRSTTSRRGNPRPPTRSARSRRLPTGRRHAPSSGRRHAPWRSPPPPVLDAPRPTWRGRRTNAHGRPRRVPGAP